jgi:hypothetical protein
MRVEAINKHLSKIDKLLKGIGVHENNGNRVAIREAISILNYINVEMIKKANHKG